MILILCLSNLHVPISLSLISKHRNDKILLYTDQQNIYNVFKQLNLENVNIYLRKSTDKKRNMLSRITGYLTRFRKQKKNMLNNIKHCKFTSAYFFHNCYGTPELWLLQEISPDKIYFSPTIKMDGQACNNFKSRIKTFLEKLLWNVERDAIRYGEVRYKVGKKYLSRNKIETISHDISIPKEYTSKLIETLDIKHKTILLIEDIISTKNVEQDKYFETIKNIIETWGKDNIIVKHHPRATWELKKYIKTEFLELPAYIPINIIIDKFDTVIGNYSTSIVEVIEKGKSGISLLYLFKEYYISQEMFNTHIKYLKDNDKSGKLIFPNNLTELITISKAL